jgi:hypothetical protein
VTPEPSPGKPVDEATILAECMTPPVRLILIGECHYTPTHKDNELRVVRHVAATGRPFRLLLENFSCEHAALFAAARTDAAAFDSLRAMVMQRTTGEWHMKLITAAFEAGADVEPINPPDSDEFDLDKKGRFLAAKFNLMDRSRLVLAVLGCGNLRGRAFQAALGVPEEQRRELQQDDAFPEAVYRDPKLPHRFLINGPLEGTGTPIPPRPAPR